MEKNIQINLLSYRRILSNLIDNSIDAIDSSGSITLSVAKENEKLVIFIKDTGIGIAKEFIDQVGKKGNSFGKKNGEGLGLYSAIQRVRSWGGELDISSKVGVGTSVTIKLPDVQNPRWAVDGVNFEQWEGVELLDDDATVHDRWSDVLEGKKIGLEAFLEVESYFARLNKRKTNKDNLQIIDYDLGNEKENGVDVINKIGKHKSILVTNNFSEKAVQNIVNKYDIKMMPKTMIEFL